ncbi:MAG: transcription termination/antitermination protein NusG [Mycoplasmataceae bacterium]|nr:transcription termination/antitermination protein NusG [Mycoplasmataceae bacterium]
MEINNNQTNNQNNETNIQELKNAQWFVLQVKGGIEESIIETFKDKIKNYGFEDKVANIRIFKETKTKEEVFNKGSPLLPKTLKNTKSVTWTVRPNGQYVKTTTKVLNRYRGYVFICMIYDRDAWYCIRNTPGVLGVLGSSGKGTAPQPIHIDEYLQMVKETTPDLVADTSKTDNVVEQEVIQQQAEAVKKVIYETDAQVGDSVDFISGPLEGLSGKVVSIQKDKGTAVIEYEIFGRDQKDTFSFPMFKKTAN